MWQIDKGCGMSGYYMESWTVEHSGSCVWRVPCSSHIEIDFKKEYALDSCFKSFDFFFITTQLSKCFPVAVKSYCPPFLPVYFFIYINELVLVLIMPEIFAARS
jgi:hypothetical protein